jgi:hypothetical protein
MNKKIVLKLINAIGLFAVLSDFSNADIETYPLTNTTSTAPAVKNPAETEKTVTSQQSQEEAELLAQFGKKKLGTCNMTYKLEGFSLAYRQYDGFGEVTCVNGQKASVKLSSKSIGFTIGYSSIEGEGYFTEVKNIDEILGNYISLGNHFGINRSIDRQVLTSGEISLMLIGRGHGYDIGFTIGDLSIKWR